MEHDIPSDLIVLLVLVLASNACLLCILLVNSLSLLAELCDDFLVSGNVRVCEPRVPSYICNVGSVIGQEAEHAGDQVFELVGVLCHLFVILPKYFTPVVHYQLIELILL